MMVLTVDDDVAAMIEAEARRRGLSRGELAAMLLTRIADDDLFAAVLDGDIRQPGEG
jgi:hypothetical protein